MTTITTNNKTKPRITIERTYKASVEDVWDLWTTKEGIESWWGPDGFTTEVLQLDLRAGGELRYAMTATAPAQIEFMKKVGMPLTTEGRLTYRGGDHSQAAWIYPPGRFHSGRGAVRCRDHRRVSLKWAECADGPDIRCHARRGVDREGGHGPREPTRQAGKGDSCQTLMSQAQHRRHILRASPRSALRESPWPFPVCLRLALSLDGCRSFPARPSAIDGRRPRVPRLARIQASDFLAFAMTPPA